jgi:hypothetical protein
MVMAGTDAAHLDAQPAESRALGPWVWLAIGVGSAVFGFLPWIITGMRLPLQNLWGTATLPESMPIALLPFSQYSITLIAGILIVGAAVAGIVARSTRRRQHRGGFVALVAGALGVQVVAIAETAAMVGSGLRPGRESTIYLAAIVAVAVASFAVGALVLFLVARSPRAGALIGLVIAAVAAGWWLDALIVPEPAAVSEAQIALLGILHWAPAVLCGLAIAWCGIRSTGRIIAALVSLAILAVGPALATAVSSAAGSRALARYPSEMADYGMQVFQQAVISPELTLRPVVTAIVVAVVGLGIGAVLRRRKGAGIVAVR